MNWPGRGSNQRPPVLKHCMLPPELLGLDRDKSKEMVENSVCERENTCTRGIFSLPKIFLSPSFSLVVEPLLCTCFNCKKKVIKPSIDNNCCSLNTSGLKQRFVFGRVT